MATNNDILWLPNTLPATKETRKKMVHAVFIDHPIKCFSIYWVALACVSNSPTGFLSSFWVLLSSTTITQINSLLLKLWLGRAPNLFTNSLSRYWFFFFQYICSLLYCSWLLRYLGNIKGFERFEIFVSKFIFFKTT